MNKNICFTAGLIMVICVLAYTNGYTADYKIGFINMREIMQNTNAGKKAGEELKIFFDKKREGIVEEEKELKMLKDELDKQGSLLNETARREKVTTYQRKLRDYQLLVDDTQKELKARDQQIAGKLIPEIAKVVRKVAEKEKYTLVIDVASLPLPYYAQENDFSKKVIEEFNKLPAAGD